MATDIKDSTPPAMTPWTDEKRAEFARRVENRLAAWQANYEASGAVCASPLMDQIIAEAAVAEEMDRGEPDPHADINTNTEAP